MLHQGRRGPRGLVEIDPFQPELPGREPRRAARRVRQRPGGLHAPGPVGGRLAASNSESGEGIGDASAGPRSRWSRAAPVCCTDVFGGGDNFAVGRDAPPEAVDFLKYLTTDLDVVEAWAGLGDGTLPTVVGSEAFVTDSEPAVDPGRAARGDVRAGIPRPGDEPGRSARPSTTRSPDWSRACSLPRRSPRPSRTRQPSSRLSPVAPDPTSSGPALAPARSFDT